jgi:hypothetical protein
MRRNHLNEKDRFPTLLSYPPRFASKIRMPRKSAPHPPKQNVSRALGKTGMFWIKRLDILEIIFNKKIYKQKLFINKGFNGLLGEMGHSKICFLGRRRQGSV